MSTTFTDPATTTTPEPRRDHWGRYAVRTPAGKICGYTRATTVAKALDDGGGLLPWKASMAMTGLMRRPGLRGRWEALMSAHPDAGPWYGSPESKAAAKKLVEECAEAGGSSDRADLGTALHAIVEQHNRGGTPTVTQDETRDDLAAYVTAINAARITFDPALIEAVVVDDTHLVAGTADILAADVPGLGVVVADLKTGANLAYSWQSIAVQLAIYANANNVYRQGPAEDGSADERLPMPEVSKTHAMVIHLPAGEARCELHLVDIAAGYEAFEHSMWARQWRKRKNLTKPHKFAAPVLPAVEQRPAGSGEADAPDPAVDRREALRERYRRLNTNGKARFAKSNPDPDDLDAVEVDIILAEKLQHLPPHVTPRPEPPRETPTPEPRLADDIEGVDAELATWHAVADRYSHLDAASKTFIRDIAREAAEAEVWIGGLGNNTERRFGILAGLVALAEHEHDDDGLVRLLIFSVTGDGNTEQPGLPLGSVVGSMDAVEAGRFHLLALAFCDGNTTTTTEPGGVTRLVRAARGGEV